MKKLIVLLTSILNLMCYAVEARTYTNFWPPYAIDIPDNFIDRDGMMVDRDGMGVYDFCADGGDSYGANNLANNQEGIAISIKSRFCFFDGDTVSDRDIQSIIKQNMNMSENLGQNAIYLPCVVSQKYRAISSVIVTEYDNFNYYVMGLEVFMHGRDIYVLVEGHDVKEMAQILKTFRCVEQH